MRIQTVKAARYTYIQRQPTLCGPEAGMQPSASKNTTSYICEILRIIVEKILANEQTAPAVDYYKDISTLVVIL